MPRGTRQILTTEQKALIVTELACYTPPSKISKMLKEKWSIDVPANTIVYYDPDSAGTTVGKQWREMFAKTRERFIARCARAPIKRQEYRFQKMQDVLEKEESRENTVGMRETLELAAKEDGGAFTNRREMTGANGAPLMPTELVVRFVRPEPKNPEPTPATSPADGNGG